MKVLLKNISSILLLFLFLFPLVEKEVHALEHTDDVHCSSVDKHFHEIEHSCSICDYSVPDSNEPSLVNFSFRSFSSNFVYEYSTKQLLAVPVFSYLPARAPPVI